MATCRKVGEARHQDSWMFFLLGDFVVFWLDTTNRFYVIQKQLSLFLHPSSPLSRVFSDRFEDNSINVVLFKHFFELCRYDDSHIPILDPADFDPLECLRPHA
jgi:hypothetical protein